MDWKMSAYHLFKSRHIAFQTAILLKGLEGCLEVLGSAILLIIRPENINTLIFYLTRGELTEDPQDFLANQLIAAGHALTWSAWFFVSLYLLFHGAAKIALVYLLWRNKPWAYPTALMLLSLFLIYQLVRLLDSFSLLLALFSVFDMVILWFIWRDWQNVKQIYANTE